MNISRFCVRRASTAAPRPSLELLTDRQKRLYPQVEQEKTDEGYPVLKLMPRNNNVFEFRPRYTGFKSRNKSIRAVNSPREELMSENQDWPSVWSTAKTFVPSAVPLPLRQSYEEKKTKPSRRKYANTELLKIANFLHLTPVAIERHCKALLKFCNNWPEGLETDEDIRRHFPVTYIERDYVHSSPTIRDPKARIVDLTVNMKDLKLNARDEDKLKRLAAHRFDESTGVITIRVKDCPMKIQNKDYSDYLLTALYYESMKHEKWEDDKPECDWEKFFWDKSESKSKIGKYISEEIDDRKEIVEDYKLSLEKLYDEENHETVATYRKSVEKLMGIQ